MRANAKVRWVIQEIVGIACVVYFAFGLYASGSLPLHLAVVGAIGFILGLEPMAEHLIEKMRQTPAM